MTAATLADWITTRPFALPDLGPGIDGERRQELATALQAIAADSTVQALVLFGSSANGSARSDSDLDLLVVERSPHLAGQAKEESWWRLFEPLQSSRLAVDLPAGGSDRQRQRRGRPPGRLPLACDQRSSPPRPGAGGAAMTPQEDARVLLALVDRHLLALRLNLDLTYPDEEWDFTL